MSEELKSGKWLGKRVIHGSVKMRYFDTEEEAIEYEQS